MCNKLEVSKHHLALVNFYPQLFTAVLDSVLDAGLKAYCSLRNRKFSVGLKGHYYSLDR